MSQGKLVFMVLQKGLFCCLTRADNVSATRSAKPKLTVCNKTGQNMVKPYFFAFVTQERLAGEESFGILLVTPPAK